MNIHTRKGAGMAVVVLALCLFGALSLHSPPVQAESDATWSQPSVTSTFQPGQSTTTVVTLTAREGVGPGTIFITPALVPFVSVSPTTTGRLKKGQVQQFVLTFSAPTNALPTTTQGTIQLRENESNGRLGELIAPRLTVATSVVWPTYVNPTSGITFSYPTNMDVSVDGGDGTISLRQAGSTTSLTNPDGPASIHISMDANPLSLSPSAYYDATLGASTGVVSVNTRTGYQYVPSATLSGTVVVIVPLANKFLRIEDAEDSFQDNGVFSQLLKTIVVGN